MCQGMCETLLARYHLYKTANRPTSRWNSISTSDGESKVTFTDIWNSTVISLHLDSPHRQVPRVIWLEIQIRGHCIGYGSELS